MPRSHSEEKIPMAAASTIRGRSLVRLKNCRQPQNSSGFPGHDRSRSQVVGVFSGFSKVDKVSGRIKISELELHLFGSSSKSLAQRNTSTYNIPSRDLAASEVAHN